MSSCSKCGGPVRADNKSGICTTNRECLNAWQKAHYAGYIATQPWAFRRTEDDRKRRYGVTPEQWQEMIADGCWICHTQVRLCVDHDHHCCPDKGKNTCGNCVRGALCHPCNVRLGQAESHPSVPLSDAEKEYLKMSAHLRGEL